MVFATKQGRGSLAGGGGMGVGRERYVGGLQGGILRKCYIRITCARGIAVFGTLVYSAGKGQNYAHRVQRTVGDSEVVACSSHALAES